MRSAALGAAVLVMLGCGGSGGTGPVPCGGEADGPARILFIGNSLTYTNELPYMVRALADSAGKPPGVDQVALPDYSLEDHWNDGRAARAIRGGCWTYVVLQQGPSSQPQGRALLLEYAARFDAIVRAQGGRSALLSVWPAESRRADFDSAVESYALAADGVHGTMLPAATAWLRAWERDPVLALYADGLHPTPAGSYLAALVIAARLSGHAPADMPRAFTVRAPNASRTVRFDAATAATLQAAAQAALDAYPSPAGASVR